MTDNATANVVKLPTRETTKTDAPAAPVSPRVRLLLQLGALDPQDPQVIRLREVITSRAPRSVLLLGGGSGRIAQAIGDACDELTVVEQDNDMLEALRRRLTTLSRPTVDLIRANPADAQLGRRFSTVIIPSDAFNGARDGDDRAALVNAAVRHLSSDGRVVVQALNPQWLMNADVNVQPVIDGWHQLQVTTPTPPITVSIRDGGYDSWTATRRARVEYRFADGEVLVDDVHATAVTGSEIDRLLRAAQLSIATQGPQLGGAHSVTDADQVVWTIIGQPAGPRGI